ncbi:MAG: peptidylprolyl isomerase [Cyclobacteriaceae bacterium]|jgi:peptidyl-prolyl cis-trans isomerase B (cyclophilin B)
MKTISSLLTLLTALFVMTSCAQKNDYVVTIKTPYGDMTAILYDETPKHKENFIKLAKDHYFDSLLFHRVMQGFMIQGGDPESRNAQPGQQLGSGGPGYTVEAEFNSKLYHERGALSAARLPDEMNPKKASSGSQFYIVQGRVFTSEDIDALKIDQAKFGQAFQQWMMNAANKPMIDTLNAIYMKGDMAGYQRALFALAPEIEKQTGINVTKPLSPEMEKAYTTVGGAPHLDGGYTVFGRVIKGLDVIDKVASQPVFGQGHRPVKDIRMAVTVEEMSRKKITKEFGYVYPDSK